MTKKLKWIYNEVLGWIEIEDKGEVSLVPNWFSAMKIQSFFGVLGILIVSNAVEAKEQAKTTVKRRIKRNLIEVNSLNSPGIRVFRPFPDPYNRAIPGLQWSTEAFNNILINNALLLSQYDRLQASQLAYLKNVANFFQAAPNDGMARLNQATQIAAEKRIMQRAYANSYLPTQFRFNEVDLMVLAAKTGVIGAVSGYVAYSLMSLLFSSSKRKELAIQLRGGFFDPASFLTTAVFGKLKEAVGTFLNGKKEEVMEKLDLGSLLNGEKKKEKRFPIQISNPLIIAMASFVALAAFLARGGKIEDIPIANDVVAILKPKKTGALRQLGNTIKWMYNPTQIQGWIAWPATTITIYFVFQKFPVLHILEK